MRTFYALAIGFALLIGCGPTLHSVSGTVTYDKAAVPDGDIIFRPKVGVSGPRAGKIKDGKYAVALSPGVYSVEVRASKKMPLPKGVVGAMGETEMDQEYIGEKYNNNTNLSADITGPKVLDFDLTSR
jgi:hypothetical protein